MAYGLINAMGIDLNAICWPFHSSNVLVPFWFVSPHSRSPGASQHYCNRIVVNNQVRLSNIISYIVEYKLFSSLHHENNLFIKEDEILYNSNS